MEQGARRFVVACVVFQRGLVQQTLMLALSQFPSTLGTTESSPLGMGGLFAFISSTPPCLEIKRTYDTRLWFGTTHNSAGNPTGKNVLVVPTKPVTFALDIGAREDWGILLLFSATPA